MRFEIDRCRRAVPRRRDRHRHAPGRVGALRRARPTTSTAASSTHRGAGLRRVRPPGPRADAAPSWPSPPATSHGPADGRACRARSAATARGDDRHPAGAARERRGARWISDVGRRRAGGDDDRGGRGGAGDGREPRPPPRVVAVGDARRRAGRDVDRACRSAATVHRSLRPTVAGVPVVVPLAWWAMALPAREVAHAALGRALVAAAGASRSAPSRSRPGTCSSTRR